MAVFKNGIFAYDNGRPITPQSTGIDLLGIQTCQQFFISGSITDVTQRSALYILVGDLQNYGIWNKMKAIYPMVGQAGVSSSFELNLKDPNTFKGVFSGGWSYGSTGATPDGSTGYMNTGFNPNTNGLAYNNNHLSYYSRTSAAAGATQFYEMGSSNAAYTDVLSLWSRRSNDTAGYDSGDYTTNRATFANTNGQGFYLGTAASTTGKFFKNGINQVDKALSPSSISNVNVYIGGFNENNSTRFYSNKECAFASIGDGLTDTEAANFYTAVQRFQTTLGRQV